MLWKRSKPFSKFPKIFHFCSPPPISRWCRRAFTTKPCRGLNQAIGPHLVQSVSSGKFRPAGILEKKSEKEVPGTKIEKKPILIEKTPQKTKKFTDIFFIRETKYQRERKN